MSDNTENTTIEKTSFFSSIKKEVWYIAIAVVVVIAGLVIYNKHVDNQYEKMMAKLDSEKEAIVRELDIIDQNVNESKAKLDDINKTSNQTVATLVEELSAIREGVTKVEIKSDEEVKMYLDYLAGQSNSNAGTNIGH